MGVACPKVGVAARSGEAALGDIYVTWGVLGLCAGGGVLAVLVVLALAEKTV